MPEKVKLPKEVAEAIDYFRSIGHMNRTILEEISDPTASSSGIELRKYVYATDDGYDVLLQALVNGYEVEQTPEEMVRDYYQSLEQKAREDMNKLSVNSIRNEYSIEMKGIAITLKMLGIKIEGVNA